MYPSSQISVRNFHLIEENFHNLEVLPGWRDANCFEFSFTQQENMFWINRTIVLTEFSVIIIVYNL